MENKILVDKSILDKLYVTPCLQELKKGFTGNIRAIIQTEPEQQAGIWDKENKQIKKFNQNGIYYNDTSDYFDKLWYDSIKIDNDKYDMITKNNLLDISSWKIHGFNIDMSNNEIQQGGMMSKMECSYLTRKKKWLMYLNFILDKMNLYSLDKINVIIVTHHNRMKDKNINKGLIPFYKSYTKNPNNVNSYANCFCVKLEINNNKLQKKTIIDKGYPDKDINLNYQRAYDNIQQILPYDNENINSQNYKGGFLPNNLKKDKRYIYCGFKSDNDEETIDTTDIEIVLQELGYKLNDKIINIYIVRHGNSLHNKPLNIKNGKQLDSCLTPLGIFQAEQTGIKIKENIQLNHNYPILSLVSFLRRTQHTCLSILKQIYTNIYETKTFDTKLREFKEETFKRTNISNIDIIQNIFSNELYRQEDKKNFNDWLKTNIININTIGGKKLKKTNKNKKLKINKKSKYIDNTFKKYNKIKKNTFKKNNHKDKKSNKK